MTNASNAMATKVQRRCLGKAIGPVEEDKYPPRCPNDTLPWKKYCTMHVK